MSVRAYKTIGILGGMGPLATVDLFNKIVRLTEARTDQDHLPIVIVNTPAIPDRTEAILAQGEDPTPALAAAAETLKGAGADFLVAPCNNAHVFLHRMTLPLPLVSMIDATVTRLVSLGVTRAAILGTKGTMRSRIYHDALHRAGLVPIEPTEAEADVLTAMIYDVIKAGRFDADPKPFADVCQALHARGAERLILGCTELPIAVDLYATPGDFVDPTTEVARAAVIAAGGRLAPFEGPFS